MLLFSTAVHMGRLSLRHSSPLCSFCSALHIASPGTMSDDAPITIPYSALLEDDLTPLSDSITRAFGSSADALGLILVSGLPAEFAKLRENALLASARFAALPEDVRERCTDPDSHFSFGWSHGKGEHAKPSEPDAMKAAARQEKLHLFNAELGTLA